MLTMQRNRKLLSRTVCATLSIVIRGLQTNQIVFNIHNSHKNGSLSLYLNLNSPRASPFREVVSVQIFKDTRDLYKLSLPLHPAPTFLVRCMHV